MVNKEEKKKSSKIGRLKDEEIKKLADMEKRIETAMKDKNIATIEELCKMIEHNRTSCPANGMYSKLKSPAKNKEGFYNMTIKTLYIIADELGVSTDYLLGRTELMATFDKLKVKNLGLSNDSLKKLRDIHLASEKYDKRKQNSSSEYYQNPYKKALIALNWLIEHTDINTEEKDRYDDDFLTLLYYLVMLRFDGVADSTEVVINGYIEAADDEKNKYEELLYEYGTTDDKERLRAELVKARKAYITKKKINDRSRSILGDALNGIVSVGDPLTRDQIKIRVKDPVESLLKQLQRIIDMWRQEYETTYNERKEQQKKEYENFADDMIKKIKEDVEPEEEDMEETEPDASTYITPYLRNLPVGEQKLYFLLFYIEKSGLVNMRINENGVVSFANKDHPRFMELIKKAEDDETGIYVSKTGEIMYSEDKAMMPTERAKMLFERYNLPTILKEWMTKIRGKMVYNSYFDEYNYFEYRSQNEAEGIVAEAKKAGVSYSVDGDILTVWKNEKPATGGN